MTFVKSILFASATALTLGLTIPAHSADKVTLNIWTVDKDGQPAPALVKEFDESEPNIDVVYRTIPFADLMSEALRAYSVGKAPDIFAVDNPDQAMLSARGVLLDLSDMIKTSDSIKVENYFEGPMTSTMWDGKHFGIPKATNTIAVFYNKDMYKAAGITETPKTWDELLEVSRKLTNPEKEVYGLAFSAKASEEGTFQFLPFAQMGGASFTNINADGAVKALDFLKTLIKEGIASRDTLSRSQWESTATFNAGATAMSISGPWEINRMSSDAKFDWGVFLLPTMSEGGTRSSAMGDFNWVVFNSTKHPKEAFKALEFFADQDKDLFARFGQLPARNDVTIPSTGDAKKDAALKVFLEQMKYSKPRGPHPEWPKISKAIQEAIQGSLTGAMSSKDALDIAASKIDALVK